MGLRFGIAIVTLFFAMNMVAQNHHLVSPDGDIDVHVSLEKSLTYKVDFQGESVIDPSSISFTFLNAPPLGNDMKVTGENKTTIDETWKPVLKRYETIRNHYNSLPMRIAFPVLTLSRSDPDETMLIKQIEGLDDEFANPEEVVVVTVFGQGRMIPLTSEELVPDVINELCWFLCSACSCRVKALNPGIDMLLTANWDEAKYSYPEAVTTICPNGKTFSLGGTGIVVQASANREQTVEPSQAGPEQDAPTPSPSIPPIAWLATLAIIVTGTLIWVLKK